MLRLPHRLSNQRGIYTVMLAVFLPVVVGVMILILDISRYYISKTRLQNAADLAALSGMRTYVDKLPNTSFRDVHLDAKLTTQVNNYTLPSMPTTDMKLGSYSTATASHFQDLFISQGTSPINNANVNALQLTLRADTTSMLNVLGRHVSMTATATAVACRTTGGEFDITLEGICPCGNGTRQDYEMCDYGASNSSSPCNPPLTYFMTQPPINQRTTSCTWCSLICEEATEMRTNPYCGDSALQNQTTNPGLSGANEQCDEGMGTNGPTCTTTCQCKDGFKPDPNGGASCIPKDHCLDDPYRTQLETSRGEECLNGTWGCDGSTCRCDTSAGFSANPSSPGTCMQNTTSQCTSGCENTLTTFPGCSSPSILANKTIWAACNVGASTPDQAGNKNLFMNTPIQSMCPSGWHVAEHSDWSDAQSSAEWTTLKNNLLRSSTGVGNITSPVNSSNWRGPNGNTSFFASNTGLPEVMAVSPSGNLSQEFCLNGSPSVTGGNIFRCSSSGVSFTTTTYPQNLSVRCVRNCDKCDEPPPSCLGTMPSGTGVKVCGNATTNVTANRNWALVSNFNTESSCQQGMCQAYCDGSQNYSYQNGKCEQPVIVNVDLTMSPLMTKLNNEPVSSAASSRSYDSLTQVTLLNQLNKNNATVTNGITVTYYYTTNAAQINNIPAGYTAFASKSGLDMSASEFSKIVNHLHQNGAVSSSTPYYLISCADTGNVITESNENNNCSQPATMIINPLCPNGQINSGEQCDSGANCLSNCQCPANYVPNASLGCSPVAPPVGTPALNASTGACGGKINLSWSATNATSYILWRYTPGTPAGTVMGLSHAPDWTPVTGYINTAATSAEMTLGPGVSQMYGVWATSDNWATYKAASATTTSSTLCPSITATTSSTCGGRVNVSWSATNANQYAVWRYQPGASGTYHGQFVSDWILILDNTTATQLVSTVPASSSQWYAVWATNNNWANFSAAASNFATASSACIVCGNAMMNTGEQCDDGNTSSGDGCSYPGCQCDGGYEFNPVKQECVLADKCKNVVCNPDANVCTTESCNPTTGLCQSTNNNNPCGDANACNGQEMCSGGICQAGTPMQCDDGNACNGTESCSNGSCQSGTPMQCSDGNACNGVETCSNGACQSGSPILCDDGNACNGTETCSNGSCQSGTPLQCDDGNACNGTESCSNGSCQSGTPMQCDDGDACNGTESCANGSCQSGTPLQCDDGDSCNGTEYCAGGGCQSGTPMQCDDGDGCNGVEYCSGGSCQSGSPIQCDDGDGCNGEEYCSGGSCQSGTPVQCDDGDACNGTETCSGGSCQSGSPMQCDDGDGCNGEEYCSGGSCQGGTPVECDDGDDCNGTEYCSDGSCQSGVAPTNDPSCGGCPGGCDDGDACNGTEYCSAGVCQPGTPMTCDDGDACNGTEYCSGGGCQGGTPMECDDGEYCNGAEYCSGGSCQPGTPPDDPDNCGGGCSNCVANNACDSATCVGNTCVHATIECDDGDSCTSDSCDPSSGCSYEDNGSCTPPPENPADSCSWDKPMPVAKVDTDGDGVQEIICCGMPGWATAGEDKCGDRCTLDWVLTIPVYDPSNPEGGYCGRSIVDCIPDGPEQDCNMDGEIGYPIDRDGDGYVDGTSPECCSSPSPPQIDCSEYIARAANCTNIGKDCMDNPDGPSAGCVCCNALIDE